MLDGVWAFLRQSDLRKDGHNVMIYRNEVPNLEFEVGVEVSRTFEVRGAGSCVATPGGSLGTHDPHGRLRGVARRTRRRHPLVPDERVHDDRDSVGDVRRLGPRP